MKSLLFGGGPQECWDEVLGSRNQGVRGTQSLMNSHFYFPTPTKKRVCNFLTKPEMSTVRADGDGHGETVLLLTVVGEEHDREKCDGTATTLVAMGFNVASVPSLRNFFCHYVRSCEDLRPVSVRFWCSGG